jgi:hypothetical protein
MKSHSTIVATRYPFRRQILILDWTASGVRMGSEDTGLSWNVHPRRTVAGSVFRRPAGALSFLRKGAFFVVAMRNHACDGSFTVPVCGMPSVSLSSASLVSSGEK